MPLKPWSEKYAKRDPHLVYTMIPNVGKNSVIIQKHHILPHPTMHFVYLWHSNVSKQCEDFRSFSKLSYTPFSGVYAFFRLHLINHIFNPVVYLTLDTVSESDRQDLFLTGFLLDKTSNETQLSLQDTFW